MREIHRIAIVLSLFAFGAAGAAGCESKQQSREKYCSTLSALSQRYAELDAMGPNTTIHDVMAVAQKLQDDTQRTAKAARGIGTPAAKQLTEAADRLDSDAHHVSADTTVAQLKARLATDGAEVKQRAQALATESGCPRAISLR
jgi:hypothetical protein